MRIRQCAGRDYLYSETGSQIRRIIPFSPLLSQARDTENHINLDSLDLGINANKTYHQSRRWLIRYIVFYAVSAIFRPYDGGQSRQSKQALGVIRQRTCNDSPVSLQRFYNFSPFERVVQIMGVRQIFTRYCTFFSHQLEIHVPTKKSNRLDNYQSRVVLN